MFEHRTKPLLPRKEYYRRLMQHAVLGILVITVSLGIGMTGYHVFEKLPWVDAFVNAAMILSGMGPVATLQTDGGKIFAGCYALFSGIALITILGIIFATVIHRFLHKFHLEDEARGGKRTKIAAVKRRFQTFAPAAKLRTQPDCPAKPSLIQARQFGTRDLGRRNEADVCPPELAPLETRH